MKKSVYTLALVAGISLAFTSCKKEEPKSEMEINKIEQSQETVPVDHWETDKDTTQLKEDSAVVTETKVTKEN